MAQADAPMITPEAAKKHHAEHIKEFSEVFNRKAPTLDLLSYFAVNTRTFPITDLLLPLATDVLVMTESCFYRKNLIP